MKSDIVQSILEAIAQKEKDELRRLQKNQQKMKVEKLVDANGKDRSKCRLFIFEGDCLDENTEIKVIREEGLIDVKIKDTLIGDNVLTHKNRIGTITASSKKIGKKVIIKNKLEDLVCSSTHKWFVYDNDINQFYFIETTGLDKSKHKLVKNYLAFMSELVTINSIEKIENIDEYYDYILEFTNKEDKLYVTENHKFACFNKETEYFEMIECKNLSKDIHLLVNVNKK